MTYIPNQGDIVWLNFSPQKGHEQKGRRPALVVSNEDFNKLDYPLAMVCPITNTDRNIPIHIKLDNRTTTTGVVMTDQVKALDLSQRTAVYIEQIPIDILDDICDIIRGFTEIEDSISEIEFERMEIAIGLLDILNIETIAEKTRLTVEQVKKLKEDYSPK